MSSGNSEFLASHPGQHEEARVAHAEQALGDWAEVQFFDYVETGHGHEGPCGPSCSHNQQEADKYADDLFADLHSHGEHNHGHEGPCGPSCSHNQQEADKYADDLFADLHSHGEHNHGHEGPCGPSCSHNQQEADKYADDLFADLNDDPTEQTDGTVPTDGKPPLDTEASGKIAPSDETVDNSEIFAEQARKEAERAITNQPYEEIQEQEIVTIPPTKIDESTESTNQATQEARRISYDDRPIVFNETIGDPDESPVGTTLTNEEAVKPTPDSPSINTMPTDQQTNTLQNLQSVPEEDPLNLGAPSIASETHLAVAKNQLEEFIDETMVETTALDQTEIGQSFAILDDEEEATVIDPEATISTADGVSHATPMISVTPETTSASDGNIDLLTTEVSARTKITGTEITNLVTQEDINEAVVLFEDIINQLELALVDNKTNELQDSVLMNKLRELSEILSVDYGELTKLIGNEENLTQKQYEILYEILMGLRSDLSIEQSFEFNQNASQQAQSNSASTPKNIGQLILAILTRRLQTDNVALVA